MKIEPATKHRMLRNVALVALLMTPVVQASEPLLIDVHRDAKCGCCKKWIEYLKANGFEVQDHVESDMAAVKHRFSVAPQLASCHTAIIDGKFVEGHVPAVQILELKNQPDLLGIAVPGMPAGSPGMEYGRVQHAYQVIGLTSSGTNRVMASYPAN